MAMKKEEDFIELLEQEKALFSDAGHTPMAVVAAFTEAIVPVLDTVFSSTKYSVEERVWYVGAAWELALCYQYKDYQNPRCDITKICGINAVIASIKESAGLEVLHGRFSIPRYEQIAAIKLVFDTTELDGVLQSFRNGLNIRASASDQEVQFKNQYLALLGVKVEAAKLSPNEMLELDRLVAECNQRKQRVFELTKSLDTQTKRAVDAEKECIQCKQRVFELSTSLYEEMNRAEDAEREVRRLTNEQKREPKSARSSHHHRKGREFDSRQGSSRGVKRKRESSTSPPPPKRRKTSSDPSRHEGRRRERGRNERRSRGRKMGKMW